jgi:uncharacterized protein YbbK (DUF523 family)
MAAHIGRVEALSPTTTRPRIGVSACLLGRDVRYDGGHKRNPFVAGALGRFVELVPVCPEVEAGFSVPRESLSLRANASGPRLVGNRSGADHTDRMRAYAEQRVAALATADLDGFVLKRDSPSCGVERVRLYPEGDGPPVREGTGYSPPPCANACPPFPSPRRGGCATRPAARPSSSASTPITGYEPTSWPPRPATSSSPSTPTTSCCTWRTARPTTPPWAPGGRPG